MALCGVLRFCGLLCVLISAAEGRWFESAFTPEHVRALRNETRALFNHAWDSYMEFGFPYDEVRPITCAPYGPNYEDPMNVVRNDAMGNVSLTVLDNIDTLVIMEEWDQLERILSYLHSEKDTLFVKNTVVQVFEASIRSLGGLLSAHLLLTDITNKPSVPPNLFRFKQIADKYDGFLLGMAHDLGTRLLPAYRTRNNVPLPRINLAHGIKGVPAKLQRETCTSGATTPVLEFTLLSRLTGDPRFESYTQLTFWKLWLSRLPLDLLPMTIDTVKDEWMDSITGVGASIDSFYEYSAKAAILFNDNAMWEVFKASYKSLLTHLADGGGPSDGAMIFTNVDTKVGAVSTSWIDLLGAFFPGLQVLTGQLSDAVKTHMTYLKIWDRYDLIPERWNYATNTGDNLELLLAASNSIEANILNQAQVQRAIPLEWYPLRPEFIESTYYLFRATRDPMYLHIGARILELLKTKYRRKCGFAGFQDIRLGTMQNRMETFVMSETLKYLYLLFDANDEVFLHQNKVMGRKNWIFSTEAHPLWFDRHLSPLHSKFIVKERPEDMVLPTVVQQLFLSLLLSKIRDQGHTPLAAVTEGTSYKNLSLPHRYDVEFPAVLEHSYLEKTDLLDDRLSVCEVRPLALGIASKRDFQVSGYYRFDRLYEADHRYRETLIRPVHLQPEVSIESNKSFFENHSLIFRGSQEGLFLQSPRTVTTKSYDLFVGAREAISSSEVSTIRYNTHVDVAEAPVLEKDLWVPELNSLRLRLEILEAGKIDTHNVLITTEYVQNLGQDSENGTSGTEGTATALRITKINGQHVTQGLIVWTSAFEPFPGENGQPPVIDIAADSRVILQGKVVENLMVWEV